VFEGEAERVRGWVKANTLNWSARARRVASQVHGRPMGIDKVNVQWRMEALVRGDGRLGEF